MIHEDIRDLENVREVSMIELLLHHLPTCIGSPLSIAALSRLLQATHDSIERWERTNIPRFYQTHLKKQDFGNAEANTRILPFSTFCKELALP